MTEPQQVIRLADQTPSVRIVAGGAKGDKGDDGPPGPPGPAGGDTYVHDQGAPAAVWVITHNLARFPSVTVVDTAGSVCEGDFDYVSVNQVVLTFNAPFSGKAYLN